MKDKYNVCEGDGSRQAVKGTVERERGNELGEWPYAVRKSKIDRFS